MTQRYYNPFAGIDLLYPDEQRDFYLRYCQKTGSDAIDRCPFPRMVDFWFAGLSLAARKQLAPVNIAKQETTKFIEGSIFDRDSWRVQVVMLVSIAIENNVEIVGEPRRMMAIANGLAAAGVPEVVGMLLDGGQAAIWNLSETLDEILRKRQHKEKQSP